MTDYRRTEQELWEEDAIAEEDRRAQVVPKVEPVDDASVPARDSVESVARFIADPALLAGPSTERSLDAPSRSLAALQLLDAEDLEEVAELPEARPQSVPPALPAPLNKPVPSELPSMLLGPPISTRGDATERVTSMPKTHPLANSIAPGGSALSLAPRPPKRSLRGQVALGAVALLALGMTASRFLQSRGEHHAVTATRAQVALERRDEPEAAELPPERDEPEAAEEPIVIEAWPDMAEATPKLAPVASQAPHAVRDRPEATSPRTPPHREEAEPATGAPPRSVHVAVGSVEVRPDQGPATPELVPAQPDRAQVVAALNALTERLRACVGDEHGIADVTLTVRAPGTVSHALVEGTFAGSDKGSCIARMLRSAKLPRFTEPVVRIEYPFEL